MIFVDSSFIISILLETDPNHIRAKNTWNNTPIEKLISENILMEVLTVVSQRKGRNFAIEAYHDISVDHKLFPVTTDRFQSGLKLFLNPKLQKDISLIDCITAAICHELHIKHILSFDSHFRKFGLIPVP